jgi:hypothetical protein
MQQTKNPKAKQTYQRAWENASDTLKLDAPVFSS